MTKAIFIDAGHGLGPTGAIDNGASGNGTTERAEVVKIAQNLFVRLKADSSFAGVCIMKIGVDDRMMLKDHIKQINDECKANNWSANDALVISIHLNAASSPEARGVEAWYSAEEGTINFAKALVEQVSATTGIPIRPTSTLVTSQNRWGRLGIIDDTIPRGCLVECGFVTNQFDAAVFKDAQMNDCVARGILQAIRSYLALPVLSGPVTPPTSFSDVSPLAWYAGAVQTCLDEGIFQMSSDGCFHPERPITRAEMATIMARHLSRHHGIH